MHSDKGRVLEAGCDWLTLVVLHEDNAYDLIVQDWFDIIRAERVRTGLIEDSGKLGYVGLQAGSAFWGRRHDGDMLIISGGEANAYLQQATALSPRIRRADWQVTYVVEQPELWPVHQARKQADEANALLPAGRQRKIHTHSDNREGYTLYVGSRQSDEFCRLYHKRAQAPERYPEGSWRWEVQFNGDKAGASVTAFLEASRTPEGYAMDLLRDWFRRRGIDTPWDSTSEIDSRFTDVLPATPLVDKLNWLYTQVGPSARLLSDQGHTAEVMRVLFGKDWLEYLLGRLTTEGAESNATER